MNQAKHTEEGFVGCTSGRRRALGGLKNRLFGLSTPTEADELRLVGEDKRTKKCTGVKKRNMAKAAFGLYVIFSFLRLGAEPRV